MEEKAELRLDSEPGKEIQSLEIEVWNVFFEKEENRIKFIFPSKLEMEIHVILGVGKVESCNSTGIFSKPEFLES